MSSPSSCTRFLFQDALDTCEEIDAELADLIKRNERTLLEIKSDLRKAKREAVASSGQQPRPPESRPTDALTSPKKARAHVDTGHATTSTLGAALANAAPPPLPRPGTASGNRVLSASHAVIADVVDPTSGAVAGASGLAAGFRPNTPNLLGRPILTVEDVEAAYEAIAVAQLRRSTFAAQASSLPGDPVKAAVNVPATSNAGAGNSGDEDEDEDEEDEGDSDNAADVLVVHQ